MRRELRRHPVQAKPGKNTNRPVRTRVGPAQPRSGAAIGPATGRVRFLPGMLQPAWFREILIELRKVQWPTVQETRNLTLVVLVVSAALGMFLGGLDAGFNWLIEHTLLG